MSLSGPRKRTVGVGCGNPQNLHHDDARDQTYPTLSPIHRTWRRLVFERSASASLSLSRRLEKLFPHVVCRRRPLELFAAAAGGARTRTDTGGRKGKSPKTRYEFLSIGIGIGLMTTCASGEIVGRKAGIESWTPTTQPNRWSRAERCPQVSGLDVGPAVAAES